MLQKLRHSTSHAR